MMHKQKRFEEANHAIDMAIGLEANSAPHYVLKAQIGRDKDRDCAVTEYLDTAWRRFPKIVSQSDWELWWYITATEMRDDKGSAAAAREERSRRKVVVVHAGSESQGLLPVLVA
jgi:hypothetical protein